MADEPSRDRDSGHDAGPSLELPSLRSALGFGRKRRASRDATPSDGPVDRPETAVPLEPVAAEAGPGSAEPAPDEAASLTHPEADQEPTAPAEAASVPHPDQVKPAPVAPAEAAPAEAASLTHPDTGPEQIAPVPVVPEPDAGPHLSPGPVGLPETRPEQPTAPLPFPREPEPVARRLATRPRLDLHLPGPLVALLVGAVAGLALVGLTKAGLQACTALRGTSSCGKPGILLLLAATVLTVLLGALLLRLAGVDSAGSTSFLGVGLLVVVILLALLPVIYAWWMVVVVPLVAMATYAAAWWLTTTYVEPGERAR